MSNKKSSDEIFKSVVEGADLRSALARIAKDIDKKHIPVEESIRDLIGMGKYMRKSLDVLQMILVVLILLLVICSTLLVAYHYHTYVLDVDK